MKKKSLQSLLLTGALGMMAFGVSAQQGLVDKTLHQRSIVIEDFTGSSCGYCPNGTNAIAKMKTDYPGRIFALAIHSGSFTSRDPFTGNPFADKLLAHAGTPTSKPIGRVQRNIYTNKRAWGINSAGTQWVNPAKAILDDATELSAVNVGVKSVKEGNKYIVDVEVYFPSSVNAGVNVTVALVQNGYTSYQADYPRGSAWPDDYVNKDILRWMNTTDAMGEKIDAGKTSKGSFVKYHYEVPIEASWEKAGTDVYTYEVIAFASETKSTLPSKDGDNIYSVVGVDAESGSTYDQYFPNGTANNSDKWGGIATSVNTLAETTDVSVYPNPINSNTKLKINLQEAVNVSYEVINVLGVVVDSKNLGVVNGMNEIDFDGDFTSVNGTYFLRLKLDNEVVTRHLTVM